MSKPSVIVGGFPELAELFKRSGRFARVFQVGSTATFQQQAASAQYPGKEELVLVFADNTPEDGPKLEFILSRLAGAGYPTLLINVGGTAAELSAKYPTIGTIRGGSTLNQILGAISGGSPHMVEPVQWGHVQVHAGMTYPQESDPTAQAPTKAPTPPPAERSGYVPRPARDAWTPNSQEAGAAEVATPNILNPKQRFAGGQETGGEADAPAPGSGGWGTPQPAPNPSDEQGWAPANRESSQPQQQPQPQQRPQPHPAPTPYAPPTPAPAPETASGWGAGVYTGEPEVPAAPARRQAAGVPQNVIVPSTGLHAPNKCTAITVAASKGGTGKSSVALNIAAFLGLRTSQDVAIIDLNIQQADVGKYIGDYDSKTVIDLVSNLPQITPDNIRDYMAYSREGDFYAILGPHNPQLADPGVLNSRLYKTILDLLRRTFDYVIIDTPVAERYHDLTTNFAMKEADRVVFVVAPNWTTIHNARLYLDMMTREVSGPRLPLDRVGWVLNQYQEDIDCDVDQVRSAMAQYKFLGTLPYTTEWQRANNNFELIVTQRYDDINRAFAEMLGQVTNIEFPVRPLAERKKSWYDRLRKR